MSDFLSMAVAGVLIGSLYGILALPLTFVWKTTGVFDFAVGAYVAVGGIVAAEIGIPYGPIIGVFAAVAVSLIPAGLFLLFKWRQADGDGLGMGLATFGLSLAVSAGVLVWYGTSPRFLSFVEGSFIWGEIVVNKSRLIAGVVAMVVLIVVLVALSRTSLGLKIRAAASSSDHAALLGVPVRSMQCGALIVSGLLCGVVGVLAASTIGLAYTSTLQLSVLGLSASVLLGLRGPGTAFAGGIVLGLIQSLAQGYVGGHIAGVIPPLLILLVLATGLTTRGTMIGARP
ncbi:hypothetical protein ACH47B_36800 [Rhodococcus sp. NPDC019627]|uniref:branched-chain amino acid ABC transporter permease n=1 Tax=unclassified Rhodococcus (in: high G+C Gram-positive bacteria) TaxID=192944 RepID=UPI0033F6130B